MSVQNLGYFESLAQIKKISSLVKSDEKEQVPLLDSLGRILAIDVFSQSERPSFDRVMMDGYAISRQNILHAINGGTNLAKVDLSEIPLVKAGDNRLVASSKERGRREIVAKVMTGSILPSDADMVVKVEDIHHFLKSDKTFVENYPSFVALKGSESQKGEKILSQGDTISASHLAVLAENNLEKVTVYKKSTVAIFSTGNEIVPPGEELHVGQMRDSNSSLIWGKIKEDPICQNNFNPTILGNLSDNPEIIENGLSLFFDKNRGDMAILSGGISMGDFDFVPLVIKKMGFSFIIEKIKQCPGRPFILAYREIDKKIIVALPGNSVSTLVCMEALVLPLLKATLNIRGRREERLDPSLVKVKIDHVPERYLKLKSEEKWIDDRLHWIPLKYRDRQFIVEEKYKSSGHIDSMVNVVAFLLYGKECDERGMHSVALLTSQFNTINRALMISEEM